MKERSELLKDTRRFPVYPLEEIEVGLRGEVLSYLGNNPDIASQLTVIRTTRSKFGDLTIPCFQLGQTLGRDPKRIANELANQLAVRTQTDSVLSYRQEGPFVNICLNYEIFGPRVLENVLRSGIMYGAENIGHGAHLLVDMSSASVAKRMTIGYLRSTIIGDAIAKILDFEGFRITRDNHIGDWGMKFAHLINGIMKYGKMEEIEQHPLDELQKIYVRAVKEAEASETVREQGKEILRKLESGTPDIRHLWERIVSWTLDDYNAVYRILGVNFEMALRDSFYNPLIASTIERIKESCITKESEGALVVDLRDRDLGVAIVQKADGTSLYLAREIATVFYRLEQIKADGILYVVGNDQTLFFQQLFETMKRMGYDLTTRCKHVAFGMITLQEGKITTLSQNILLRDVLDKLLEKAKTMTTERSRSDSENEMKAARAMAVGGLKWIDLSVDPRQSYKFDWDKVLDLRSNGGVYIQYTHARASSLLEKVPVDERMCVEGIEHPLEKQLILEVADFNVAVRRAAETFNPSGIAAYLTRLCLTFNKFYQDLQITGTSQENINRLVITAAVRQVIANGLFLLGIEAPQKI